MAALGHHSIVMVALVATMDDFLGSAEPELARRP
jgi:hypothetical protein